MNYNNKRSKSGAGRPSANIQNRPIVRRQYVDIVRLDNDMFNYNPDSPVGAMQQPFIAKFEDQNELGPIRNRSCTDIWCLLLFVVFIVGWVGAICFICQYVNVKKSIYPADSYGNICGEGNYTDRPYLAFFNIFKCAASLETSIIDGCETKQICVEKCPQFTFSINPDETRDVRQKQLAQAVCIYNSHPTVDNIYDLVKKDECARVYFNSDQIGGRCIPSVVRFFGKFVLDELNHKELIGENGTKILSNELVKNNHVLAILMNALSYGSQISSDLIQTGKWIAIGLVVTMLVAFSWIFLMQWIAAYMTWLSILAILVLNIFSLYYSANQYLILREPNSNTNTSLFNNTDNSDVLFSQFFADTYSSNANIVNRDVDIPEDDVMTNTMKYYRNGRSEKGFSGEDLKLTIDFDFKEQLKDQLGTYLQKSGTWLVFTIILAITLFIITLLLLCLCRRITMAIAVIKEASKAVDSMKSTLFFPVIPFVLKLASIGLWVLSFIILSSASHPQYRDPNGKNCIPDIDLPNSSPNCTLRRVFSRQMVYYAHGINLFAIIWMLFWIYGICYVALSGAFASYYWTFDKKNVPFFALLSSFYRAIRYHPGSVAFGALLISIIRFIRFVLEYVDNKCKKYADYSAVRAILCLCKCCFWCLESFLKFINQNAYIMIAIYGKSFCPSARDGFLLIAENGVRAVVLNCVSEFLLFISKLAVTAIMGVAGFFVLTNRAEFLVQFTDLNYYYVPLTLFVILSYIVSSTFFNVYNVAIDTIFMCYLQDMKVNDGHDKPYYMAKSLQNVFGNQNRN